MRVLFLLLVLGLVSAAAWHTRPSHGLHRGVASELMAQGRVARPEPVSGAWSFEDFVVTTRSTMRSGDRSLMECWGFFTRFLCMGATPQVDATVAG